MLGLAHTAKVKPHNGYMEYGDVFVTCDVTDRGPVWSQDRSVMGTRVLGLCGSHANTVGAAVTEGTRLASPGVQFPSQLDNARLDRDTVRWLHGRSALTGPEQPAATEFQAVKVALGEGTMGMLTRDGSVFTWGDGLQGQLGIGKLATASEPQLVSSLQKFNIVDVSYGGSHAVALTDDGGLYSWGRGHEGQIGLGMKHAIPLHVNVTVTPRFIGKLLSTPIGRVSCGHQFTVAVSKAGELWSWGEGGCGQLGYPKVSQSPIPQHVNATDAAGRSIVWCDVACGWAHVIGLTATNDVYSWGLNCKGQLGLGDLKARSTPQLIVNPLWHDALPSPTASHHSDSKLDVSVRSESLAQSPHSAVFNDNGNNINNMNAVNMSVGTLEEQWMGESKLDIEDGGVGTLNQSMSYADSLRRDVSMKSQALQKSIHDAMSLPAVIPPPPPPPVPVPLWQYPHGNTLKGIIIAAGKHHSAVVNELGELYTWGSSDGGRLGHGYEDVSLPVSNGHSVYRFITPIICPKRVNDGQLATRIVSDVTCTSNATVAFTPSVLQSLSPTSGFATGGKRVSLTGVGLASLAWIRRVGREADTRSPVVSIYDVSTDDPNLVEEELGPGLVAIPDVYVKFTQATNPTSQVPGTGGGGATSFAAPIVKFVRAYSRVPSDTQPDDHTITCLSPVFGIETDATVELIVGALDGTQRPIRGSLKYTFFAAPSLTGVFPNCLPLSQTTTKPLIRISGSGLFGTMLADKLARPLADALVSQVNDILERRDEEEARALRMLQNGGVDPEELTQDSKLSEEQSKPSSTKKTATTALKKGTPGGKKISAATTSEDTPTTVKRREPPPPVGITLYTANANQTTATTATTASYHEVRLRFLLLVDGKVKVTSDVVPGWYEGKYEEVPPEPPKPKAIGEDDDDDESEDEKTDDVTKQGRDAVKSTYSGSVLCVMPSLTLPESIMKAMQAGEDISGNGGNVAPSIGIRVEVSPNGNDFIRCSEVIQSYITYIDGEHAYPHYTPVTGGTTVSVMGFCIPNTWNMNAKLTVALPRAMNVASNALTTIVPVDYIDVNTIQFTMPRLETPESQGIPTPRSEGVGVRSVDELSQQSLTVASCPPELMSQRRSDCVSEEGNVVRPLLPPGRYPVKVELALNGELFEDVGIRLEAYNALLDSLTPSCGVVSGGTQMIVKPDTTTAIVSNWFIASEETHIRVHNDTFDVRVPCSYDSEANVVRFTMPSLIPSVDTSSNTTPDANASAITGSGEGESVVPTTARSTTTTTTTAAATATGGVDGGAGGDVTQPLTTLSKLVTVSLAFADGQYLDASGPMVFSYYEAEKLCVKAITPATVPLTGKTTVTVEGWEAMDTSLFKVKLVRPGPEHTLEKELHAVVSGDKSGVTLDMPGTVDGWSPGEGFITVTIDGQYWTPITEPTAKLTLGPEPKAKK